MKRMSFLILLLLALRPVLPAQEEMVYAQAADISLQICPDSANQQVFVTWEMKQPGDAVLSLIHESGEMTLSIPLKKLPACRYAKAVSIQAFCPGNYLVVVAMGDRVYAEKWNIPEPFSEF